jgi:hypothetical protein
VIYQFFSVSHRSANGSSEYTGDGLRAGGWMTLDFSALSALVAGLLPVPFERLSGNKEKREEKK